MRDLKDLLRLIRKQNKLIGEDKKMCFVDVQGKEHPLLSCEIEEDVLIVRYGPYETSIARDDLSSIEFTDELVEGLDIQGEPWQIQFAEYGHNPVEDTSNPIDDDEDESEMEDHDPFDDGIDDDNNIRTSDDY